MLNNTIDGNESRIIRLKKQSRAQMNGKFGGLFLCYLVVWVIGFICTNIAGINSVQGSIDQWEQVFKSAPFIPSLVFEGIENMSHAVSAGADVLSLVPFLYWILLYPVLCVGLTQVLLNLTYGDRPAVGMLFEPYKSRFVNSVGTVWIKKLFEIIWGILFYILTVVVFMFVFAFFVSRGEYNYLMSVYDGTVPGFFSVVIRIFSKLLTAFVVLIILLTVIWVVYSIVISKYSMALYIMNECPLYNCYECVKESKRIMYGRRWEFFLLKFSFLPWILLEIVTLGLAGIYVIPYMELTFTNYYHNIKVDALEKGTEDQKPVTDVSNADLL